ncbi:hypothetical protein ACVWW7_006554 [Bradyrhizobium sp. LM6.9]
MNATPMKSRIGMDLGVGRNRVERGGVLDASQYEEMDAPQEEGCRPDRCRRRAVAEDRKELADCRLDQDEAGDVCEAASDPIAGRRSEADIFTEASLGIGVDAGVQVRPTTRERLKNEGEHQHAGTRDDPGDQRPEDARGVSKRCGQREDAGADHRPDHERDERATRKLLVDLVRRRSHEGEWLSGRR